MARIPRNILAPGSIKAGTTGVRLNPELASQVGKAQIQEAEAQGKFVQDEINKVKDQFTENYSLTESVNLQEQALQIMEESKKEIPEDGSGYTQLVKSKFRAVLDKTLSNAPTVEARRRLINLGTSISGKLYGQGFKEELRMAQNFRIGKVEKATQVLANRAMLHPETYQDAQEQANILVDSLKKEGMDPSQVDKIRKQTTQQIITSSIKGLNNKNPEAAFNVLNNDEIVKQLTPERYNSLVLTTLSKIKQQHKLAAKQREESMFAAEYARGTVLNNKDKLSQKISDKAYDSFMLLNKEVKDTQTMFNNMYEHTLINPSVVSSKMTGQIVSQLRHGKIEQQVASAVLIGKLDENEKTRSEINRLISKEDILLAETLNRHINDGMPAKQAFALAQDSLQPKTSAEDKESKKEAHILYKDSKEDLIPEPFFGEPKGKSKLITSAKEIYLKEYVRDKDDELARLRTKKELSRKFTVSNVNEGSEYFRVAPEKATGMNPIKLKQQLFETVFNRKISHLGPQATAEQALNVEGSGESRITEEDLKKAGIHVADRVFVAGTALQSDSNYKVHIVEDDKTTDQTPSYKIKFTDGAGGFAYSTKRMLFNNAEQEQKLQEDQAKLQRLKQDRDEYNAQSAIGFNVKKHALVDRVNHDQRVKVFKQVEAIGND